MSNYTPTPRHVGRMLRDRARAEWLRQAEAHVTLARHWNEMGRPDAGREAVQTNAHRALSLVGGIGRSALRDQQDRARRVEADLAARGFTRCVGCCAATPSRLY